MTADIDDLIGIPYKDHGRDHNGMDCYGLAIEAAARFGYKLNDVVYENHNAELADVYAPTLNVHRIEKPREGALLEMTADNGNLHIGICINNKEFIHETRNGSRINRIGVLPVRNIYGIDIRL
ncbi:NlpC/P60 family protein [Treponema peruense]|uniref:C40 family peptidase n=1 Tax=Treponema peruense TaxID=2787628 RepID=A0A7T3RBG3_9SPIR|nr:NlpC/P60 family protein [Treponema peruense]QQA00020.1 C40 family peptidase [Treponema peruense]QQA01317.1 C40 family peptidase [Treponema peruense]